jgi:hypothetical protein
VNVDGAIVSADGGLASSLTPLGDAYTREVSIVVP